MELSAMREDDFYDAQSDASQVKTRIVTKYFRFWTKVMIPQAKRWAGKLAYFDLYAGPGSYQDGTKSTPVLILEDAIANPDLCNLLVTVFNDANPEHAETLRANIKAIPGVDKLKHQPKTYDGEVDESVSALFARTNLVPTFTFIDPFGYKGVTLQLLRAMLKDWGCDLILFFSYARINAAIENGFFEEHLADLFGEERLALLREAVKGKRPWEREAIVLETFAQALHAMGFKFVLPFSFQRPGQDRTSHYLIFVTKNELGYRVMKEIMAAESSEFDQGVPSFDYSASVSEGETPLLFSLDRPLEVLADDLLERFQGSTLSMREIFERHHVGKRYIERNYKAALNSLEEAGKIAANPVAAKRPMRAGKRTFGNDVRVTFPARKIH